MSKSQTIKPPEFVEVKYSPGQWVKADGGPEVMVTQVRYNCLGVSYLCEWWSDRTLMSGVLFEAQISGACETQRQRAIRGFSFPDSWSPDYGKMLQPSKEV